MYLWKKWFIENLILKHLIVLFCWPISLLYLGGPIFCKDDLQPKYTFGSNVKPHIIFTLCGVPAPNVTWSFHDKNGTAERKPVANYTYEYQIELPQLIQKTCGMEIVLSATGYNSKENRSRLLLESCKYWNSQSHLEVP